MRMDKIDEAKREGVKALSYSPSQGKKQARAGWIQMIISRIFNYDGKAEEAEKMVKPVRQYSGNSTQKGSPFLS